MATADTTGKLTKLAAAGVLKSILPWIRKHPLQTFGYTALAAPALTHAVNTLQGYNPEKALGPMAQGNTFTTMTPRSVRTGQDAYELMNPLDQADRPGMIDPLKLLEQYRARARARG
jgi:hypothetical protein